MSDFLKPADGLFFGQSRTYHLKVRETLLAHITSTPLAGLVVLPSFAPEYVLWISQDRQRYYAVYRTGQTSIWQALQQPLAASVSFHTCNAELPPELAQALAAVFWAALGQTRYSGNEGIMLDGTSYYVTACQVGSGSRTGQTWSPNFSSNVGKLVALTQRLIQQLTQPDDNPNRWIALTEAAVVLQAEFNDF